MFAKALVANRGEIAVRIIRALREMNVRSVAIFSEADRRAPHVSMADEAVCVGSPPSAESYLKGERIVQAALDRGAEAIHPGYGFLSENAAFAKLCEGRGCKFIGPHWTAIEQMGSKTRAREIAAQAGAPIIPGSRGDLADETEARRQAAAIGYPVLIKAAAGGGGKGMRRVDSDADLFSSLNAASGEALRAFGSGEVYLEKLIERPRHIEIQILADEHGHAIHLGERECSIQRRHQKIVEECPSPLVLARPELREKIGRAALEIAAAVNYSNAGTMEFLADQNGNFYFLEMNTRLQVEHPVTELVTGIDLVHWQLRIASGEQLTLRQSDVRWNGSAIECRVYAEDPDNQFFPSTGTVAHYREPAGPGVRVDSGIYDGWQVGIDYDPLLAKLSVWAGSREAAIDRMRRAVAEYSILGLTTNLSLFEDLMADEQWRRGDLDTALLERFMQARVSRTKGNEETIASLLAAAIASRAKTNDASGSPQNSAASDTWRRSGRTALQRLG